MQEPTITAPETGRDPIESNSEATHTPFTPSESWIKQYQKQATAKLIAGLNQFARTRALAVADAGRKVDDYYARELVLDALGDTWLGVVRWDPEKCSLGYHLVRTIEGRADKHRKHALAHHHDALEPDDACAERTSSHTGWRRTLRQQLRLRVPVVAAQISGVANSPDPRAAAAPRGPRHARCSVGSERRSRTDIS